MSNEDTIIDCAHKMAAAITSTHFHELGFMDDEVSPEKWEYYEDIAYNSIMNAAERWMA